MISKISVFKTDPEKYPHLKLYNCMSQFRSRIHKLIRSTSDLKILTRFFNARPNGFTCGYIATVDQLFFYLQGWYVIYKVDTLFTRLIRYLQGWHVSLNNPENYFKFDARCLASKNDRSVRNRNFWTDYFSYFCRFFFNFSKN